MPIRCAPLPCRHHHRADCSSQHVAATCPRTAARGRAWQRQCAHCASPPCTARRCPHPQRRLALEAPPLRTAAAMVASLPAPHLLLAHTACHPARSATVTQPRRPAVARDASAGANAAREGTRCPYRHVQCGKELFGCKHEGGAQRAAIPVRTFRAAEVVMRSCNAAQRRHDAPQHRAHARERQRPSEQCIPAVLCRHGLHEVKQGALAFESAATQRYAL